MVGGLVLANNGHEVPAWLSASIGATIGNFGIIVLVLFNASRANGNGNGAYANGVRQGGVAGTSVSSSTGIKAG